MPTQKRTPDHLDSDERARTPSGGSVENRLEKTVAAVTAQCIITESLIHALCSELPDISRTRLINVLNCVHEELQAGLGSDDDIVKAFGEQRDSMRTLLVSSVIRAEIGMIFDRENTKADRTAS